MGDWRYFPHMTTPVLPSHRLFLECEADSPPLTESLFLNQSGLCNRLQQLSAEGWCLETLLGGRKQYHFLWVLSVSLSSGPSRHVVRKPWPRGGVPANSSGKNPSQPPDMWMNAPSGDSGFQPLDLPAGVPDFSGREKPPPLNSAFFCLNSWPSETVSSFTH